MAERSRDVDDDFSATRKALIAERNRLQDAMEQWEEKRLCFLKEAKCSGTVQVGDCSIAYEFYHKTTLAFNRKQVCCCLNPTDTYNSYHNWFKTLSAAQQVKAHPSRIQAVSQTRVLVKEFLTVWGLQSMLVYNSSKYPTANLIEKSMQEVLLFPQFVPQERRRKLEDHIIEKILAALVDIADIQTKAQAQCQIPKEGSCSKRSCDLLIWSGEGEDTHYLDIECNENDHKSYSPDYHTARERDLRLCYRNIDFYYFNPNTVDEESIVENVVDRCCQIADLAVGGYH